jgi:hypothetical protein
MDSHNWTNRELQLLEEWDWAVRYIEAQDSKAVSLKQRITRSLLEAKLIISNKLIITYNYLSFEPSAILFFKEYLSEREQALSQMEMPLQFHPINFNNIWEYKSYLEFTREMMLEKL